MYFSDALLQKKWKNIRDWFSRELGEKPKSGDGSRKKTPYMYSQQLQFLRDTLAFRKTTNSLVPDVQVCGDTDFNVSSPSIDVTEEATKPPPRKRSRTNNHLIEKKIIEVLGKNMTDRQEIAKNNQDADRLYLLSLLPALKFIQPHLILKAKMKILEVLDEFPKINYPNCNNEPQTLEILYPTQSESDLTENMF
ncbi:hypothetical protein AVEN_69136-1 [Araneus ventricosus]|uniref:BESS domain-containing protein n=1 Tax=Araneus ventricosus TaxID=182803 RepID=A0A4Y2HTG9_ARAVE|nr:hypothetical protein AVEN_69136-1 [Araneus ventricosus]